MLVPLSWLSEYVKLPSSVDKLAEKLLLSGTKVEDIHKKKGEVVFELEITPNRADTLSIYGVAREVAALTGVELKEPEVDTVRELVVKGAKPALKVSEKKLCPSYSLVRINQVVVKDSPEWVKEYLSLAGIRPINNVVDITNFVMLELGQPMHAFDADKIKGELVIRPAKRGEKVRTLDSQEREVNEGAIIIEDSEKLIDLAGLMGGENSEVDEKTENILLHVPIYNPINIRKTSLFTSLRTEASNRFEKKLDLNLHPLALKRALKLFTELASAQSCSPTATIGYPTPARSLEFDSSLVKKILGLDLEEGDIINLLTPLGFLISSSPLVGNSLLIQIPSHRPDVALPEDILEEIGRIFGYNNFPKTLPAGEVPEQKELFLPNNYDLLRREVLKAGFDEVTGYTLVPAKDLENFTFTKEKAVRVLHPTSVDFEYLRPYLLINLLKAVSANQSHASTLSFYEIGKEFNAKIDPKTKLPEQKVALGLISTSAYQNLKGAVERLLSFFDIEASEEIVSSDNKFWEFGVNFLENKKVVAQVGKVRNDLLKKYEISIPTFSAWLDFEYLEKLPRKAQFAPEPKFPSVIEDLSFFIKGGTSTKQIIKALAKVDRLIGKVDFIDAFWKDGRPSVTLRLYYQDPDKTLTDKDVVSIRKKIEKFLVSKFKVSLRID